jgi:DNA repair protein RadC
MAALPRGKHVAGVTNGYHAAADHPREHLCALGARALAWRELVALLVGSGGVHGSASAEADRILEVAEGSLRRLAALDVVALELGRRDASEGYAERERIQGPGDVYILLGTRLRDLRHEEFHALLLDTRHSVVREALVTRVTLDA